MKLLQITRAVQSTLEKLKPNNVEEAYQEHFYSELSKLSAEELVSARKEYSTCLRNLRDLDELRGYFRSKFDAIGDDSYDDFCCWIISMGEDCFKDASGERISLDKYIESFDQGCYFEILGPTFTSVYEELIGDDINDML